MLRPTALVVLAVASAGCSLASGTLGGREKCWDESDSRFATLWRGVLHIDASGARLDTPEGEVIPLVPGSLTARLGQDGVGELVSDSVVVAKAGQDVTVFGGGGSDGAIVVCTIAEIHS
jgi:hypothetical protein